MSTVRPNESDDPGAPIASRDALVAFFAEAEKPRARFLVGTEHEKFGFLRKDRSPLPFFGDNGIEAILHDIQTLDPAFERAQDSGHTIALFHPDGSSITLEPGGQFELSGAPFRTIHETSAEVGRHLALLQRVCAPRGVGFFGMGFHPTATWEQLPLVPKARYGVMTRYMPQVGRRGLDMMKRTCTVQANFDWENEQDFVESFRAALAMQPLVAALFASSPFYEGKPTGGLCERQRVWAETDPQRAGFPACVLDDNFSYARYLDWVLAVPMYFVRRDGQHHDVAGASFVDFMQQGLLGTRATMRDFADHLTTIFPEVRAKKVLEVRSADAGPWDHLAALPALHKGVLYDRTARDAVWALFDGPTSLELSNLRRDVAERGFLARYRNKTVLWLCERLLDIAADGLIRQDARDSSGKTEACYLRPLVERVASGQTFAEELLKRYAGPWRGDASAAIEALSYFGPEDGDDLVGPCGDVAHRYTPGMPLSV